MRTYTSPPLIQTWKTPSGIIGRANMLIFGEIIEAHRKAALSGGTPTARDLRNIDQEALRAFPEVLNELRENGFYPNGVDEKGMPRFDQVRDSAVNVLYEANKEQYQHLTPEDCQQIARSGWVRIMQQVKMEGK